MPTKLIIIRGNSGSGKTIVAKKSAPGSVMVLATIPCSCSRMCCDVTS